MNIHINKTEDLEYHILYICLKLKKCNVNPNSKLKQNSEKSVSSIGFAANAVKYANCVKSPQTYSFELIDHLTRYFNYFHKFC